MSEFDFNKEPKLDERLSAETKKKLYELFDRAVNDSAPDTDEEYITARVALDEPELTSAPESSLPILQVRKPKIENIDKYGWAYEVVYGTQESNSSLHIIFPKDETELPPRVTSYEVDEVSGPSYPNRELSEADANRLLFDLHNALDSIKKLKNS